MLTCSQGPEGNPLLLLVLSLKAWVFVEGCVCVCVWWWGSDTQSTLTTGDASIQMWKSSLNTQFVVHTLCSLGVPQTNKFNCRIDQNRYSYGWEELHYYPKIKTIKYKGIFIGKDKPISFSYLTIFKQRKLSI